MESIHSRNVQRVRVFPLQRESDVLRHHLESGMGSIISDSAMVIWSPRQMTTSTHVLLPIWGYGALPSIRGGHCCFGDRQVNTQFWTQEGLSSVCSEWLNGEEVLLHVEGD